MNAFFSKLFNFSKSATQKIAQNVAVRPAKIVQILNISSKDSILILDVGNERLVVGASASGIGLIRALSLQAPHLDAAKPVDQGAFRAQVNATHMAQQAGVDQSVLARQRQVQPQEAAPRATPRQPSPQPAVPRPDQVGAGSSPAVMKRQANDFGDIYRDVEAAIHAASDDHD